MNKIKLYNKKIEITFKDKGHIYKVNGQRCSYSVTGITGLLDKPALKFWACNEMEKALLSLIEENQDIISVPNLAEWITQSKSAHAKRSREAANVGSMVHEWVENFINKQIQGDDRPPIPPPTEDSQVLNGVIGFLDFVDKHGAKFISTEEIVYSKKHNYIGKMDAIMTLADEDHKKLHFVDFKTSSGFYNEMFFQLAAYENAYWENVVEENRIPDKNLGDQYIIRFGKKDGVFDFKKISQPEVYENLKAFLGLLAAKKRILEIKNGQKIKK